MDRNIIIIPTYNEKENIGLLIEKVFSLSIPFEILIIDDNSPDGTANIVQSFRKKYPDTLHPIERGGKQGLGTAYLTGFKWALENEYDYIFEMDADFSHNPDDLERLYKACSEKGADMAIGSRYKDGVTVINWPIGRLIMSYYASVYVHIITVMPVKDATAGFVCYSSRVLSTMELDRIRMKGYGFQIEMKYTAWKSGFRLCEVPIIFMDRTRGTSKMNSGIFGEAFWGVLRLPFKKVKKYSGKHQ